MKNTIKPMRLSFYDHRDYHDWNPSYYIEQFKMYGMYVAHEDKTFTDSKGMPYTITIFYLRDLGFL